MRRAVLSAPEFRERGRCSAPRFVVLACACVISLVHAWFSVHVATTGSTSCTPTTTLRYDSRVAASQARLDVTANGYMDAVTNVRISDKFNFSSAMGHLWSNLVLGSLELIELPSIAIKLLDGDADVSLDIQHAVQARADALCLIGVQASDLNSTNWTVELDIGGKLSLRNTSAPLLPENSRQIVLHNESVVELEAAAEDYNYIVLVKGSARHTRFVKPALEQRFVLLPSSEFLGSALSSCCICLRFAVSWRLLFRLALQTCSFPPSMWGSWIPR